MAKEHLLVVVRPLLFHQQCQSQHKQMVEEQKRLMLLLLSLLLLRTWRKEGQHPLLIFVPLQQELKFLPILVEHENSCKNKGIK